MYWKIYLATFIVTAATDTAADAVEAAATADWEIDETQSGPHKRVFSINRSKPKQHTTTKQNSQVFSIVIVECDKTKMVSGAWGPISM